MIFGEKGIIQCRMHSLRCWLLVYLRRELYEDP